MLTKMNINRYPYVLLFLYFIAAAETNAQFNKVIFQKFLHLSYNNYNLQALGDWNGDGYGDFLI